MQLLLTISKDWSGNNIHPKADLYMFLQQKQTQKCQYLVRLCTFNAGWLQPRPWRQVDGQ